MIVFKNFRIRILYCGLCKLIDLLDVIVRFNFDIVNL